MPEIINFCKENIFLLLVFMGCSRHHNFRNCCFLGCSTASTSSRRRRASSATASLTKALYLRMFRPSLSVQNGLVTYLNEDNANDLLGYQMFVTVTLGHGFTVVLIHAHEHARQLRDIFHIGFSLLHANERRNCELALNYFGMLLPGLRV